MIKKNILFLLILLLASIVRLYSISSPPLFGDEIDVGYQAYSLLHTARDIKGNFLPFYLDSLAESRAPALIYFTVPSIAIFGLNTFAVRLVPLIFGLLSIVIFYKLVLLTSKSSVLALYSTSVLALSPWHIHYSRTSFELTTLSFFMLMGIYHLISFIKNNKTSSLYISAISFAITFYTYNIANIFTPLIILFIFLKNYRVFTLSRIIKPLLLGIFLTSPVIFSILSGTAANRFKMISIFNDPAVINKIIDQRTDFTTSDSPLIEKISHNKAIAYTNYFFKNYLQSFSPELIFLSGDPNPRHNLPGHGLILLPLFIPLFYGIKKGHPLFLFWLIISPISSSLTQGGGYHASRLFLMVFPLSYFIALGLESLSPILRKAMIIISALFFAMYLHEYFVHYPKAHFSHWQYGYHQLFVHQPTNATRVFVSNTKYESLERFAFFQQIDPRIIQQSSDLEKENIIGNLPGFKIEPNIFFINHWPSTDSLNEINNIAQTGDVFYLLQGKDIPGDMDLTKQPLKGYRTIDTVYYPNGQIMGQVIEKQ